MDFFKKVNKKSGSLAPIKKFYDHYEDSEGFLKKVKNNVQEWIKLSVLPTNMSLLYTILCTCQLLN